jgi:hypothetical protein
MTICREEMEQDRLARDAAAVEVWGEVRARAEAEWEGHSPQGRAEIAYAPIAAIQSRTSLDNRAIKVIVLSVVRE